MSQIGVLRWMVELGRVDIITEVSMLAPQLAYMLGETRKSCKNVARKLAYQFR